MTSHNEQEACGNICVLSTGSNGTGISCLLSGATETIVDEQTTSERCLFNAGDSAQLICSSAKIKLFSLRYVFLTSLAPHNTAGLPGFILSLSDLGVAELTIVGPPGTEGLVTNMRPFSNRKYPAVQIIEVGTERFSERANRVVKTRSFTVTCTPTYTSQSSEGRAVAVAYHALPIWTAYASSGLAVLPSESAFPTHPSAVDLLDALVEDTPLRASVVLFLPASAAALSSSCSRVALSDALSTSSWRRGLVFHCEGSLRTDACELPTSQSSLLLLQQFCGNYVSRAFSSVQETFRSSSSLPSQPTSSSSSSSSSSSASMLSPPSDAAVCITEEGDCTIQALLPGLCIKIPSMATYESWKQPARLLSLLDQYESQADRILRTSAEGITTRVRLKLSRLDTSQSSSAEGASIAEANTAFLGDKIECAPMPCLGVTEADPSTTALTNQQRAAFLRDSLLKKRPFSSLAPTPPPQQTDVRAVISEHSAAGPVAVDLGPTRNARTILSQVSDKKVEISRDSCHVTFLGTGSATPSRHRHNSCIMITLLQPASVALPMNYQQSPPPLPAGIRPPPPPPPPLHPCPNRPPLPSTRTSIEPILQQVTPSRAAVSLRNLEEDSPAALPMCWRPRGAIVLLDVGEGAAAQLFQSCHGIEEDFDATLLDIAVIWISHHHADHICGLPMLIQQVHRAWRKRARGAAIKETFNKIIIVAPPTVVAYFEYMLIISGLDDYVTFIPTVQSLYAGCTVPVSARTEGRLVRLRSVPVLHCRDAYACVLDLGNACKIVYSGDCRPSDSLIHAGINCDLLIHEATFDDSLAGDAVSKRHCTISEAVTVARRMNVGGGRRSGGLTVLTHFSQRYPLSSSTFALTSDMPVAQAFDFLQFSFPSQAAEVPILTAAVAALHTEIADSLEED